MKKNIWKELKKQNDGKQLNLEVADQKYIDKVKAYAVSQGMGMMETEIMRKDLIGMGFEVQKEGELLEERLGDVAEFTKAIVREGKAKNRREELYYFMEQAGGGYLWAVFCMLLLFVIMGAWNLAEEEILNLTGLFAILLIPWFISSWQMYVVGKVVLMKRIGGIFSAFLAVLIFLPNFVLDDIPSKWIPFYEVKVPDWVLVPILLLGSVLYGYGKKRFDEITEKIAREHHLTIEK